MNSIEKMDTNKSLPKNSSQESSSRAGNTPTTKSTGGTGRSTQDSPLSDANNNDDENSVVQLKSSEGGVYVCKLVGARMSHVIRTMMSNIDINKDHEIVLGNDAVTNESLQKIIEWVEHHWDDPEPDPDFETEVDRRSEELSHWDKQFIDVQDLGLLYDITIAANYLDIKGLVEVCGKHICGKIKGKSCEEVREILNITNDFTQEEVDAIHEENRWIYS